MNRTKNVRVLRSIKLHIDMSDFIDTMNKYASGHFSTVGLKFLFNYLEDLEESIGEEIELDPIAISSDYIEYRNLASFHEDYDADKYPDFDTIQNHTTVIFLDTLEPDEDTPFIIQAF